MLRGHKPVPFRSARRSWRSMPWVEQLESRILLNAVQFSGEQFNVGELSGTTQLNVRLEHAESSPVRVNYSLRARSASTSNFNAQGGYVDFAPGQTSQTIPITI